MFLGFAHIELWMIQRAHHLSANGSPKGTFKSENTLKSKRFKVAAAGANLALAVTMAPATIAFATKADEQATGAAAAEKYPPANEWDMTYGPGQIYAPGETVTVNPPHSAKGYVIPEGTTFESARGNPDYVTVHADGSATIAIPADAADVFNETFAARMTLPDGSEVDATHGYKIRANENQGESANFVPGYENVTLEPGEQKEIPVSEGAPVGATYKLGA